MAKPRLGEAAKTETIAVRVTAAEKAELTRRYGSPSNALRALIASVVTPKEKK